MFLQCKQSSILKKKRSTFKKKATQFTLKTILQFTSFSINTRQFEIKITLCGQTNTNKLFSTEFFVFLKISLQRNKVCLLSCLLRCKSYFVSLLSKKVSSLSYLVSSLSYLIRCKSYFINVLSKKIRPLSYLVSSLSYLVRCKSNFYNVLSKKIRSLSYLVRYSCSWCFSIKPLQCY